MNLFMPTRNGNVVSAQETHAGKSYDSNLCRSLMLLLLSIVFFTSQANAQGTWSTLTHVSPHANSGVMLVLTDGTIMCKTSSGSSNGNIWDILTPDIHGNYKNGTWTSTAAMHDDRLYFSSQVLKDGRVYVAGGEYGSGLTKGETYNPLTNAWTAAPLAGLNISDANSELLSDGRVLQAAVASDLRHTFIFDPVSNTYVAGPSTTGIHNESVWVKLPDGSILFVNRVTTVSERYNPASNTWTNDAAVPVSLYDPYGDEAGAAFLLPNGKVLFIGSAATTALYTPSGSAANGSWAAGPNFPGAPQGAPDAPAAMMVNGKVLCVVSPTPTSGDHFPDSSVYFEYDYAANTFTTVNTPFGGTLVSGFPTFIQNMVCLPDGNILFSYQGSSQYYIYTPGGSPLALGKPAVTNVIRPVACDTFKAVGTLFNGITEGAAYGDDWQMSSNYPLVRLTSGTNVYYAKTYNWNRVGAVATGAALDTVQFILPAALPVGTYTLQVVANGNASDGISFSTCGVSCSAPPISGTPSICVGLTTTLADPTTGGTWISSNTAVATVNTSTGTVTGLIAGTATITYTVGGCTALQMVTVNPISPITGNLNICNGAVSTLADATSGGTWNSGNTGAVTVPLTSGNVNGVGAGTSVITYTTGAGCTAFAIVTVNPIPGAITGISNICVGATITLGDGVTGGIWGSSSPSVATIDPVSGTVFGVAGGSTIIMYTLSSGCLAAATMSINPLSAISGPAGVCVGSSINLSDAAGSGTWSTSGLGHATVDPSTGAVSGVSVGTETITYVSGLGCSASKVVTVSPAAGSISATSIAICAGATTTLNSTVSGGTWSSSSTAQAVVDPSSGVVTGVAAGTPSIAYATGSGCSVSLLITVNALPQAISGASALCTGLTTTLTDPGGGTWSSSNAGVASINAGTGAVTGLLVGTSTITYTLSIGCSTTKAILVNQSPSSITGSSSVCPGLGITLSDGITGGNWSSTSANVSVVAGSGLVSGVSAGTASITYTLGSCSSTTIITVNAITPISGNAALCAGAPLPLSDATTGGTWFSSSTGVATVNPTTGSVISIAPGSAVITYILPSGCIVTTAITVNTAPAAIGGASAVCQGATTMLTDAVSGGAWSSSNTAKATVGAGTGVVGGVAAGTATITYAIGSCSTTKVLTVNGLAAAGTVTGTATVCTGATTTFSDATTGGVWSSGATTKATVNTSGVVTGVAAGTATISYTVTNTCSSAVATLVVTVSAAPVAGTITGTASVCAGSTTTLSDATAGGVWSSSNTAKATVSTAGLVRGIASGTATISYTVTNTCGAARATSVVTVNTTPTAGTISGPTSVAVGATITLTDASAGGVWSSSHTARATISAAGVVRGVATGSSTISYTVTNSCGTARATKRVTITAHRDAPPENTTGTTVINTPPTLQIYPNPTSGTFTVNTSTSGVLVLISMEGKEVGRFDVTELTSTLRIPYQLAGGVYVYQFIDNNGVVTPGRLVYKPQ